MGCVAVYEKELDFVVDTLHRFGTNARDVEDLAQEVFVVLHRKWGDFDASRPWRPYLCGIAFRIASAHRRRHRRERLRSEVEAEDPTSDPENRLQSRQAMELVRRALEAVPERRRAVVRMHDLDGEAVVDIAERLSISNFAVYSRLRKGRRELNAALRRLVRER